MSALSEARRESADELSPWRVAGALDQDEAEQVDQAARRDPQFARRLALAREEMAETVAANERIPPPPAALAKTLFDRIEMEPVRAMRDGPGFLARIGGRAAAWTPKLSAGRLAWIAGAVLIVLALQTMILLGARAPDESEPPAAAAQAAGAMALIQFSPRATLGEISSFLQARNASIVEGPRAGGVFMVRISDRILPKAESERLVAGLRATTSIVQSASLAPDRP